MPKRLGQLKKAFVPSEVMLNGREGIIITSKSSFLPEEPERRISRGYCRGDRPRSLYLCTY